ncbi:MAG: EthD domain-containing protein [Dehalococcoidia bacterium]|nr:EthD domain-containing protein [Dehalococcoidia bacterium]
MIKVITLLKRKQGLSREQFSKYWRETHASIALATHPAMRGYVQNHAVKLMPEGEPEYDGIAETFYDDMESLQEAFVRMQSEGGKAAGDSLEKFVDTSRMVSIITEEEVIK